MFRMTFANKITLFRIVSIPFFIACLVFYVPEKDYLKYVALGIFFLAIVSDCLDGYIARTRRQKTKAGAILDPLADKALLITAFIFVRQLTLQYSTIVLPLWVLLVVISRDIIILTGSGILLAAHQDIDIRPTWWGKLTTFFQMMTITSVLLEFEFSWLLWTAASVLTFISGVDYIRKGINALNNGHNIDKNHIQSGI